MVVQIIRIRVIRVHFLFSRFFIDSISVMTPLCISLKLWYRAFFWNVFTSAVIADPASWTFVMLASSLGVFCLACVILLSALSRYSFNASLIVFASSRFDFHFCLLALVSRDLTSLFSDSLPLLAIVKSMSVILKVSCAVLSINLSQRFLVSSSSS